ncbi:MAG: fibronectin type III domain-containing protein, partial [Candidatus Nanoarchaeia archaeon]
TGGWASTCGINAEQNYVYANITNFGSIFAPMGIPNQAPQISLNLPANGTQFNNTQNINFNFTVIDDFNTTLSCSIYLDDVLNDTNISTKNNTLTNFLINGISYGPHNWKINCSDGHMSNVSETRYFSIADTLPPTISSINVTNITTSSVIINWLTDEEANSTVNYGTNLSLGSMQSDSSFTTEHNISLSNLTPNTLYYYNVTSCDIHGNCNILGPENFTTLAAPMPAPMKGVPAGVPTFNFGTIEPGETISETFSVGSSASFRFGAESHMIILHGIVSGSHKAYIEVKSTPSKFYLGEGQSQNVDLNDDGIDDIQVTVLSIILPNSVKIRIKGLTVPPEAPEAPPVILPRKPVAPPPGPVAAFFSPLITTSAGQAILAIVIIVLAVIIAFSIQKTAARRAAARKIYRIEHMKELRRQAARQK